MIKSNLEAMSYCVSKELAENPSKLGQFALSPGVVLNLNLEGFLKRRVAV
jgi:hypothetical protein